MESKHFQKQEMQKTSIKGLWFFGLSGSGKTTSANFLKKHMFKQSLILDGDMIREHISKDLGYDIPDRKIQISRILGMCKICINSNIFPICSSVYMDTITLNSLNELNIKPIKIERDFDELKTLNIYKHNSNVLGLDLEYEKTFDVTVLKNNDKEQLFRMLRDFI